jgi:hypothetical protein
VASSTESKTRAEHLLSIDKQLFGRCLLSAALKLKRQQIYFKHCWDKAKVWKIGRDEARRIAANIVSRSFF